jgi:hypothetical protein
MEYHSLIEARAQDAQKACRAHPLTPARHDAHVSDQGRIVQSITGYC